VQPLWALGLCGEFTGSYLLDAGEHRRNKIGGMAEFISHPIHKVLSWAVIAVVAPALLFAGIAFIALGDADERDYFIAKVCFGLICLIFFAKVVQWGISRKLKTKMTPILVFIGTGLMGLIALSAINYVNSKRDAKARKLAAETKPMSESAQRDPTPQSTSQAEPSPIASNAPSGAKRKKTPYAKSQNNRQVDELQRRKEEALRALDLKDPR
jgi:hypothetical protein